MSSIEWTNETWNPVTGCTRITPGCDNCYMFQQYPRLRGMGVPGYDKAPDVVQMWPDRLDIPMRWSKPRLVFVNSMSDLFHPDVAIEFIEQVFDVMARTPEHTYQVLTKRPARAVRFLEEYNPEDLGVQPLPNVWVGVSVTGGPETAPFLDQLGRIRAAVRFVSYEPALEPFDFTQWLLPFEPGCIDWLIVGGESGPGARPFNVGWAESVIAQGAHAGVPVFVKQLGRRPYLTTPGQTAWRPSNTNKGSDPSDWPAAWRVREWPRVLKVQP